MNDPSPAATGKPRTGLWAVLVIAVAAATGVALQRGFMHRSAQQTQPAPATSAVDAHIGPDVAGEASLEPKIPEVLPQFTLPDRDGTPRRLGEWKGQPLVVNYWATWCPPCVREIPLLSALRHEWSAKGFEVIGIAVDFREDVLAFAEQQQMDYPLLIGEEEGLAAVSAVGMTPALPFTLFADSQQRIVAVKIGELHEDEAELILSRVAAVDAGELALPLAREQISDGLRRIAIRRSQEEAAGHTSAPA